VNNFYEKVIYNTENNSVISVVNLLAQRIMHLPDFQI